MFKAARGSRPEPRFSSGLYSTLASALATCPRALGPASNLLFDSFGLWEKLQAAFLEANKVAPSNRFLLPIPENWILLFCQRSAAGRRRRPRPSARHRLPAAWARVLAPLSGSLCDWSFSSDAGAEASLATHAAPDFDSALWRSFTPKKVKTGKLAPERVLLPLLVEER